jgi:hypothetical protein
VHTVFERKILISVPWRISDKYCTTVDWFCHNYNVLYDAAQKSDWYLHVVVIREMVALFLTAYHFNYARYIISAQRNNSQMLHMIDSLEGNTPCIMSQVFIMASGAVWPQSRHSRAIVMVDMESLA